MKDKIKFFIKGLFIAALIFISYKFGNRRNLKKLMEKRRELLKEKLDTNDKDIKRIKEKRENYSYLALDQEDQIKINNQYNDKIKERQKNLNKINKNPDIKRDEEILSALRDMFD